MSKSPSNKNEASKMDRRTFISTGVGLSVLSVIPNHVYAASKHGMVPPSDKICMMHIGCGTQGLAEVSALLKSPDIEIIAVADPNRESYDYIHWSENGLRDELRQLLNEPKWKDEIGRAHV